MASLVLFLPPWRRERRRSDRRGVKPGRLRQRQAEHRGTSELLSSPSCITVSPNWNWRNTNLDIVGYRLDIGPFKATAYASTSAMRCPTMAFFFFSSWGGGRSPRHAGQRPSAGRTFFSTCHNIIEKSRSAYLGRLRFCINDVFPRSLMVPSGTCRIIHGCLSVLTC